MPQVTVTVNGRAYRLRCGVGEEARLKLLAEQLNARIERLAMDTGQHGDERLLLMAALLAIDEVVDLKERLGEGDEAPAPTAEVTEAAVKVGDDDDPAGTTTASDAAADQSVADDTSPAEPPPAATIPLAPRQLTRPEAAPTVATETPASHTVRTGPASR